jgi:hypothetical protein
MDHWLKGDAHPEQDMRIAVRTNLSLLNNSLIIMILKAVNRGAMRANQNSRLNSYVDAAGNVSIWHNKAAI